MLVFLKIFLSEIQTYVDVLYFVKSAKASSCVCVLNVFTQWFSH